jgi:hypothetical protein
MSHEEFLLIHVPGATAPNPSQRKYLLTPHLQRGAVALEAHYSQNTLLPLDQPSTSSPSSTLQLGTGALDLLYIDGRPAYQMWNLNRTDISREADHPGPISLFLYISHIVHVCPTRNPQAHPTVKKGRGGEDKETVKATV